MCFCDTFFTNFNIMSAVSILVPKEYGYVLAAATGTFFLSTWHAIRVSPFRKAAGVPYPNAYASPEQLAAADSAEKKQALYLFNCAQRAHYNFMENYITFLPAMLLSGLKYPVSSAVVGAIWSVCRLAYARGYTRSDQTNGKGRLVGSGFWFCQLAVYSLVGKMGWDLLM